MVLIPVQVPFRLCGINFSEALGRQMERMNNGRTYMVAIFYYALYFVSLFFVWLSISKKITILFPQMSKDQQKVEWVEIQTNSSGLTYTPNWFTVATLVLHVTSIISFTVAIIRDATPKQLKEKYDNVFFKQIRCDPCQQDKGPRQSHCDQCKRCVSKRDHHCIWINQCVGQRNLLWFNLFLNSTAYACFLAGVSNVITIFKVMGNFPSAELNMIVLL